MIRDAHEANEAARPNDFELTRLRAALPGYFDKDGDFRLDRLQEALSSADVSMTREGYELKFLGKSYAKYLTSTRTETVVVPDVEHNAEATNAGSENLYIVGDNLDALKHLLGSYAGKVKCIYIDPPYNTGSDGFVYVDDFGFTAKDLVEKVGLDEDEAQRVIALQGKSSHSAWLTFMYPRLDLAKELLTDDGVIFVSIDDNEQANLKALCDEVFGEQGFVATVAVKNNPRGRQSNTSIAPVHDYILIYSKAAATAGIGGKRLTQAQRDEYKFEDENGNYRLLGLRQRGVASLREDRPDMFFPIYVNPESEEISLAEQAGWHEVLPRKSDGRDGRWMWGKVKCLAETDRLVAKFVARRGEYDISVKDYLNRDGLIERTKKSFTIWDDKGFNQQVGTQEVKELLAGDIASYPKPTPLLEEVVQLGAGPQDIVMDFFSGSGTTAEAVMRANAFDDGSRKFIMVQIPDVIDSGDAAYAAGYRTIDEIGRARITKAAIKVKNETGAAIDTGFKLFRLQEPSVKTLDEMQSFDPNEETLLLDDFVSKFAFDGTPGAQVALATWLVEDGFGLTAEVTCVELDEYELQVCDDTGYVIEPGLSSADAMALVAKLEAGELDLKRLVIFGYSVSFSVMHELKQNLRSLRSGQTVTVIERY
ncbi:adenine-specific DNA-methyltransferase [Luteococcus japonicus]|uniref:Adenine-specific DNA-methyltransferase n=1 Tax=Luteococcus japonicus TaxID=33984 RepID=A0A3N1ZTB7_9ACTN|nr:site-specific DNA-methyltransferase [Luteococcus japonicus]ROR54115.1 adenine-specific DNA-methyltransferase [Luteococcus japonicus]